VTFGWDFDLKADFTPDNAIAMKKQLLQKFEAWNTDLKTKQPGTSFCKKDGCSDVSITVTNYNKDFRIKINIDRVA